eukprot:CAMPEP_0172691910 /NCGR_PEP_ID=MMETSP1074-20121228/24867_1 /TAXON_ID=2916 /ORGANISM="Ceratium fusus, Strain PA161109" /LENGTH=318 /DNA_ID=CAMNT_0013512023 /DNA_START=51 /DNA_END=1007 /DNA_ORIENTATION=-
MAVNAVLVDTVDACQIAVETLSKEKEVAVDLEGIALSREGKICVIIVCGPDEADPVYLFDVCALQEDGFDDGKGCLKQLLESQDVRKVFYDVRTDNDALRHQFDVHVQNAYDVQVLWHMRFQHAEDKYLQGLKLIQSKFFEESGEISGERKMQLDSVKATGLALFAPEAGGSYAVWEERPLKQAMIDYAAADVRFLLNMKQHWDENGDVNLDSLVLKTSAERLERFVNLPDAEALNQSNKKFRDFDIPRSRFNMIVMREVKVPESKRGRVIGRQGATINEVKRTTGARVTLDPGQGARIYGFPDQVESAARKIQQIIR